MVQVIMGSTLERKTVVLSPDTTLRQALEDNGIDYTSGTMHLDGAPLGPGDLNKSFADLGVTERCYLLQVVKASNA